MGKSSFVGHCIFVSLFDGQVPVQSIPNGFLTWTVAVLLDLLEDVTAHSALAFSL